MRTSGVPEALVYFKLLALQGAKKSKLSNWHFPKDTEELLQHLSNPDHLHKPSYTHVTECMPLPAS